LASGGLDVRAIMQLLRERLGEASSGGALTTRYFLTDMKPSDLVVTRDGDAVYVGRCLSDPVWDAGAVPGAARRREAEWLNVDRPLSWRALPEALRKRMSNPNTVWDLKEQSRTVAALVGLTELVEEEEVDVPDRTAMELPRVTRDLAGSLLLDRPWLQEIADLLNEKRQVVFYGPPGTGKTFVAQALAEHATASGGSWELVQFHPAYTYEDFFEGYRPTQDDEGRLIYQLHDGPLRRIAASAVADSANPYVLVIDEINRGNLPKIFGELYFLLEYRKRPIRLQYSPEEEFRLPENLFFIGTMNTADRSIALVDSALRRRFYFFPFLPSRPPIESVLHKWLELSGHRDDAARFLTALNRALADQPAVGDEFAIGPSYFMPKDKSEPRIDHAWKYAIAPLLEERFYGTLSSAEINERFSPAVLLRADVAQPPEAPEEGGEPVA
jgi:5-methylcytosine-specific restriction enzyme B